MLVVLKGTVPATDDYGRVIRGRDGKIQWVEATQEFTYNEMQTAIHVGSRWHSRGWKPRLYIKSHDGRFRWLTSLLGQSKAA